MAGFIYLGPEAEVPISLKPNFRPEVGIEVYEGIIDFQISEPSGEKWDAFRQEVIDEFQKPVFDDWPHVGPDTSIDVVISYAGKSNKFETSAEAEFTQIFDRSVTIEDATSQFISSL